MKLNKLECLANNDHLLNKGSFKEARNLDVSTDSRTYCAPDIFFAITGEKFNGCDYLESVLHSGAKIIFYEKTPGNEEQVSRLKKKYPEVDFRAVSNGLAFLQKWANDYSGAWQKLPSRTLLGISGSNGKTTLKEMISHLLRESGTEVHTTEKNNNNHWGVPFTLLGLQETDQVGIVELGSNHPGEMAALLKCFDPQMAITTNIGSTHLEFFTDESAVFKEESLPYHKILSSPGQKIFFRNSSDPFLENLPDHPNVRSFSNQSGSDWQITTESSTMTVRRNGIDNHISETIVCPPDWGEHNFWNMGVAFLVACEILPDKSKRFAEFAPTFQFSMNRSQWIECDGMKCFLDAYNANPSSMKTSLESFLQLSSNQPTSSVLVVLGDMNELGSAATRYHEKIGEFLKDRPIGRIVFVGKYAESYALGLGTRQAEIFSKTSDLKKEWSKISQGMSLCFLKASRTLQLESLLDIN